eukprot:3725130-Rhodomonas_salina.1
MPQRRKGRLPGCLVVHITWTTPHGHIERVSLTTQPVVARYTGPPHQPVRDRVRPVRDPTMLHADGPHPTPPRANHPLHHDRDTAHTGSQNATIDATTPHSPQTPPPGSDRKLHPRWTPLGQKQPPRNPCPDTRSGTAASHPQTHRAPPRRRRQTGAPPRPNSPGTAHTACWRARSSTDTRQRNPLDHTRVHSPHTAQHQRAAAGRGTSTHTPPTLRHPRTHRPRPTQRRRRKRGPECRNQGSRGKTCRVR